MKDEVDEAREMAARYMVRNEKLEAEIASLEAKLAEREEECCKHVRTITELYTGISNKSTCPPLGS